MNSNQRERSCGDLREVVMEVMLGAGNHGMNSFERLLEKIAFELSKRSGLASAPPKLSGGPASPHGPASPLRPCDLERVLEIVWDLAREGALTFGPEASNASWPCPRRSPFGERALQYGGDRFHNAGFMKALRFEAAEISPDAVVYLREAVTTFYMDCQLSTCVMLSVAAEVEFLKLLSVAKNSKAHGRYFSRISDEQNIGTKISQFKDAMKPILTLLSKPATDELDHNLDSIECVIRTARKESGRPAGVVPPPRDQVYLYLQFFIAFAKQAMRLRQELNEAPYPRVVRLH
jgi:hypothetical protein